MRDQLPAEVQPDDSLVIFYAGHGTTVSSKVPDPEDAGKTVTRRTGYLIPVDAREQKSSDWLRLESFLDDISNLPVCDVLVILDACKSGFALSEKFKFRGEGQQEGTIAELAGCVSRRAVMTSAMHDQKAMDGGGSGNSRSPTPWSTLSRTCGLITMATVLSPQPICSHTCASKSATRPTGFIM